MPAIVFKEGTAASIPTPASGKNALFFDSSDGLPKYKTDAAAVVVLQATGTVSRDWQIACSDLVTAITTGLAASARAPRAMSLTAVRASLDTVQSSGSIFTIDIKENGTSILSTLLTIDNGEATSTTAATPAVISDATIADDSKITVHVTQVGDGTAMGLVVTLLYTG